MVSGTCRQFDDEVTVVFLFVDPVVIAMTTEMFAGSTHCSQAVNGDQHDEEGKGGELHC